MLTGSLLEKLFKTKRTILTFSHLVLDTFLKVIREELLSVYNLLHYSLRYLDPGDGKKWGGEPDPFVSMSLFSIKFYKSFQERNVSFVTTDTVYRVGGRGSFSSMY